MYTVELLLPFTLGLALCVCFSALTLMVGWQEGHLDCTKTHSSKRGFVFQQVEEERMRGNWLTQVHH